MEWIRLVRRIVLFGGLTLLAYLFVLVGSVLVPIFGGSLTTWRARNLSRWARWAAPLVGMRITVKGVPPRPPFFLVSNHLGYVDVLALASQVPCAFVAKAEIARWPLFGPLCRSVNTLFIERESKRAIPAAIEKIENTLKAGVGMVLFPEATSSDGASVLPFRPALLEPAARGKMSVSCAALTYRTPPDCPPAHLVVCWWGDMTFVDHFLHLFRIREFEATVTFGARTLAEEDRKVLAGKLHRAVEELFEPVVVHATEAVSIDP